MAKRIKCKLIFHGSYKQFEIGQFDSLADAKRFIKINSWNKPYTIIKLNN